MSLACTTSWRHVSDMPDHLKVANFLVTCWWLLCNICYDEVMMKPILCNLPLIAVKWLCVCCLVMAGYSTVCSCCCHLFWPFKLHSWSQHFGHSVFAFVAWLLIVWDLFVNKVTCIIRLVCTVVCRALCCCFRICQQTTGPMQKSDCCLPRLIDSSLHLPMLQITIETVLQWRLVVP